MHVRSFRMHKITVPVRDQSRRTALVKRLRLALGRTAKITTSSEGVTVHGPIPFDDEIKVHRMAAEVSDWVKSSRKSK